ncbi:Chromosome partition protein Smc [Vibrio cholerae]|nr:Chromosome partition protein Smc [Vibrio cholerae]
MKQLKRITLVQFYLHEAVDIEIDGATAFLGPNGSGKSSTLDAIQIAMLGGNQQYTRFNSQSVSTKQKRSLTSYCLGMLRNPDKDSDIIGRARDEARTYIILVFQDEKGNETISAGICIEADASTNEHEIKGLFVLPGQDLKANDCIVYDGNERRPISFAEFRELAREQAKKIGRTPIFTEKSNEYVQELLYALNGERMPNTRRFMSSFVKSMTLKNVDSIDQFVRDYVVEPNPVDITTFRKQVEQFVALRDLVLRTRARISKLEAILSNFKRAHQAEKRIATLQAIEAIFNVEWIAERIDKLDTEIESLENNKESAERIAISTKSECEDKQNEITRLTVNLETDKNEQLRIRLNEQIESQKQIINAYQQPEISRANRVIVALKAVINDGNFACLKSEISNTIKNLEQAREHENPGVSTIRTLGSIKNELFQIHDFSKSKLLDLQNKYSEINNEYNATKRRISAATQTGRMLNDGATLLLEIVNRSGMKAQPLSALIDIINPIWAPALESYLGNDCDALVITEGDTRKAVKLLREAKRQGVKINGAAIIQPNHLRDVNLHAKRNEFAVSVIEANNETALRFITQKLGNLRLVDTELELETYSKAITPDGMLSQGGLTKSIRLVPTSELRIGKVIQDTSYLSRYMADLKRDLTNLDIQINRIEQLDSAFKTNTNDDDQDVKAKLLVANELIQNATQQLSQLDLSNLEEYRKQLDNTIKEYKDLEEIYRKNDRLAAELKEKISTSLMSKSRLKEQLISISAEEKVKLSDPLVDYELLDNMKEEIERNESLYESRLKEVENKIGHHRPRLDRALETATDELSGYIREERLDVKVTDMNWHDRCDWTEREKEKLSSTELHRYEKEAELARQASEETLRTDIAMSLHDRIKEMELERQERNKILESCPSFTGGEKYKFTTAVVPKYSALINHIKTLARDNNNLSLFAENPDDINETLSDLVEAAINSGNASGVLDYRQFYTFDLDILVNGKRVDRMSNRQGAGSNGEHIAPMYVAAGAALAKAYRLGTPRKNKRGIGLICLDEAFHGMDTINAIATARFLRSIGLQLIMAGPELERTKLAPITQTIEVDPNGWTHKLIS